MAVLQKPPLSEQRRVSSGEAVPACRGTVEERGSMAEKNLLSIGRIAGAHGIRGEVSVEGHAGSLSLLDGVIYLRQGSGPALRREVASRRRDRGRILVRFKGTDDRNAAELLRGADLLTPEDALPPPGKDEYYIYALMGLMVVDESAEGNGRLLGRISAVSCPAGQELWSIRDARGREIILPAVPEFVKAIDPEKGEVRVSPPPGLVELYLGSTRGLSDG
jgi:16S rRNA processing protein RimM